MLAVQTIEDKSYGKNLVSSLNLLRKNGLVCDVTIKVDDVRFKVHRAVLAASSEYFLELLTEAKGPKVIEVEGIAPSAVQQCIEYVYSGKIILTAETVQSLLDVSRTFRLGKLERICREFQKNNLTVDTCIDFKFTSRSNEDTEFVNAFMQRNAEAIIPKPQFCQLNMEKAREIISAVGPRCFLSWKATMAWINYDVNNRKDCFQHLIEAMALGEYPMSFLVNTVWANVTFVEDLKRSNAACKAIFDKPEDLSLHITLKNCFALKEIIYKVSHPTETEVHDVLDKFIMDNFYDVIMQDGVGKWEDYDLQMYVTEIQHVSEYVKLYAVQKWASSYKSKLAKVPSIIKHIDFEKFSAPCLQKVIRGSVLVKNSAESTGIIMDALYKKVVTQPKACIAMLDPIYSCVNAYEPSSKTWTVIQPLNGANFDPNLGNFVSLVSFGRDLFFINGRKVFQLGLEENDKTWIEHPTSIKCSLHPFSTKAVAFQNSIYIVGILTKTREGASHVADCTLSYDIKTFTFTPFPEPKTKLVFEKCVIATEDFLYTLGGKVDDRVTGVVERYSPATKTWSLLPRMKYKRSDIAAAALDSRIYALGGKLDDVPQSAVECYNADSNTWTVIKSMKLARSYFSCFAVSGKLYVIGGDEARYDITKSDTGTIEMYDPGQNTWTIAEKNVHGLGSQAKTSYVTI